MYVFLKKLVALPMACYLENLWYILKMYIFVTIYKLGFYI